MTKSKTSVLIVGATGFCGQGVVKALSSSSAFQVTAHIRSDSSRRESATRTFEELGVDILCCPFADLSQHIQSIQPEIIASFIGTTKKEMRQAGGSYQSIDYQLNHDLIACAQQQQNHPLFLYLSSMGAEWGRWNSYLRARMMIEQELRQSDLSSIIMRPGILSGETRDQSRPTEELGAWFSHRLAGFYQTIGLQGRSDATKPLDAPAVGRFVRLVLEKYILSEKKKRTQELYALQEIHRILREE